MAGRCRTTKVNYKVNLQKTMHLQQAVELRDQLQYKERDTIIKNKIHLHQLADITLQLQLSNS